MNRIGKRIFVFLTAVLLLMSLVSLPVLAADTADVERIYGENRCLTAIEVSQVAYPDGADTVIIVTANIFPDALAGSVLAHHLGAPILLVRDNAEDMAAVLAEIERLGAENAYILGGDKAVSDALETQIETKASVERLAGESRYETAQLIAAMVGMPEDGHVFLVSGTNFPDALAIAPVAARLGIPILLTHPDYLRDDVLTAFDELDVKSVTIIGGPQAIPEALVTLLEEEEIEVEKRIYGDTREDTAVAIALAYFTEPGTVVIANGREGYPDALVGGYLGALLNAPLLLVKKDEVKDSTTTYMEDNNIGDIKVLGGDKVISDDVEDALGEIEGEEETPGGGGPVVPTPVRGMVVNPASGTLKIGDKITVTAEGAKDLRIMLWATRYETVGAAKGAYDAVERVFSARLSTLISNGLTATNHEGEFSITIDKDLVDYLAKGINDKNGTFEWKLGDVTTWIITPVDGENKPWEEYNTWDSDRVDETLFNFTLGVAVGDDTAPAITSAEVIKDGDGNLVLTVVVEGENLYSLEIDHSHGSHGKWGSANLPEFTLYTDSENPWGELKDGMDPEDFGATATYDADNQTWTLTLLADGQVMSVINSADFSNGAVEFYLVAHDVAGNSSGSMNDKSYKTVIYKPEGEDA